MRLEGKVAIVTGAAQGIGAEYAERLAAEGARVALVDVKREPVEARAEAIRAVGGEAMALEADISSVDEMNAMARRTAEAFGGIDILVNNAAIYEGYVHHTLLDLPLDEWQRFLDVNLTGVLLACRGVVPFLQARGGGTIVNQSSAGANRSRNQYGITKLGVQGITVSLARSLGPSGITVNCIAPGIIDTAATRGHYSDQELEEMVARHHAVGRIGTVEDLADALVWLVSDGASFVTGQVIRIDGGFVMHPA
jgi:3-oxoacyl-[acyl-carrier protein] reductase